MILLLYVNDMIVSSNLNTIKKLKEQLVETFKMKDLGGEILGMSIACDIKSGTLELS